MHYRLGLSHRFSFLLLLVALAGPSASQQSFQKLVSTPGTGVGALVAAETPDSGLLVGSIIAQLLRFDAGGNLLWTIQIDSSSLVDLKVDSDGNSWCLLETISTSGDQVQALVKLAPDGSMLWQRAMGDVTFLGGNICLHPAGGALVTQNSIIETFPEPIRQASHTLVNDNGATVWRRRVLVNQEGSESTAATRLQAGWLLATRGGGTAYLVRLSEAGMPQWARQLNDMHISQMAEFSNGDLLISGRTEASNDVVVARLTSAGELLWARSLSNLVLVIGNAALTPSGNVLLRTYYGNDLSGMVLLNGNGQLLWAKGFPASNASSGRPLGTSDGGHVLPMRAMGQGFAELLLIKADAQGRVANCQDIDICPSLTTLNLVLQSALAESEDYTYSQDVSRSIDTFTTAISDVCYDLEPPLPDFILPDTICQGSTATPQPLMNSTATKWWWDFGPAAIPATSTQPQPGAIRFTEPGTFLITHELNFVGCLFSFSKNLTVLPAPDIGLGPDTLLCTASDYLLDASCPSGTPCTYLWDNGSSLDRRTVTKNGIYSVTVTTDNCQLTDSVQVRFFSQTWPDLMLLLPPDTLLCLNDTLVLDAAIPGATAYQWNTGSDSSQTLITQSGIYELVVFFENCPLSTSVNILEEDCFTKIYVPNVFSPNHDGINDLFMPFGKNVDFLSMKIFNRWGSLVYSTASPINGWDGMVKGKPAGAGIFTYLIEYLEPQSGKNKHLSGDVLLLR